MSIREHRKTTFFIQACSAATAALSCAAGTGSRTRTCIRQHTSAYAYVSIRQHTSAYVSIRQHTSAYVSGRPTSAYVSIRQHTSAYVSIRQHTSAFVSIRQHTSAYVSKCKKAHTHRTDVSGRPGQHPSAYVSMRQHTSACVSIRTAQTSAVVLGSTQEICCAA